MSSWTCIYMWGRGGGAEGVSERGEGEVLRVLMRWDRGEARNIRRIVWIYKK